MVAFVLLLLLFALPATAQAQSLPQVQAGIDARGASIDDFRNADGARGSFQHRFTVYGRAGEPCLRCGRPIEKTRAAGRGTYFCAKCQRTPRARKSPSRAAPA